MFHELMTEVYAEV